MTLGDRIRRFLEPSKPWNILFLISIGLMVGYLSVINSRTLRDEAVRTAEAQAAKSSAVARCLDSRPILMNFSKHVRGVNEGFATLETNSRKTRDQTPKSDPQYNVRNANYHRMKKAAAKVSALTGLPVPTIRECKGLPPKKKPVRKHARH